MKKKKAQTRDSKHEGISHLFSLPGLLLFFPFAEKDMYGFQMNNLSKSITVNFREWPKEINELSAWLRDWLST